MPIVKSGTDPLRVRAFGVNVDNSNSSGIGSTNNARDYEKGLSVGTGLVIDGNQYQASISFSSAFTLDLLNDGVHDDNDNIRLGGDQAFGAGAVHNTCIGVSAGPLISTGDNNLCGAYGAGALLTTGSGNVLLGLNAGSTVTTGSNNVCLGNGTVAGSAAASGRIMIGNGATGSVDLGLFFPSTVAVVATAATLKHVVYDTATGQMGPFTGSAVAVSVPALAGSTGGSADGTVATISDLTTYSNSSGAIRDNLEELKVKLNAVISALAAHGLTV